MRASQVLAYIAMFMLFPVLCLYAGIMIIIKYPRNCVEYNAKQATNADKEDK